MQYPSQSVLFVFIVFLILFILMSIVQLIRISRWAYRLVLGSRDYVQHNNVKWNLAREVLCMCWIVSEMLWSIDPYGVMDILPQSIITACTVVGVTFLVSFTSYMVYAWYHLVKSTAAVCGVKRSFSIPVVHWGFTILNLQAVLHAVLTVAMIIIFQLALLDIVAYNVSLISFAGLAVYNTVIGLDWFVVSVFILRQVITLTDNVIAENEFVDKLDPLRWVRSLLVPFSAHSVLYAAPLGLLISLYFCLVHLLPSS